MERKIEPSERHAERFQEEIVLTPTELREFLTCPACWYVHRFEKQFPPKTEEQHAGRVLHDLARRIHGAGVGQGRGPQLTNPKLVAKFFDRYPTVIADEGCSDRDFSQFLASGAFLDLERSLKAQILVYSLLWSRGDPDKKNAGVKCEVGLEREVEIGSRRIKVMAVADQLREVEVLNDEEKWRKPTKKIEIWELKRRVTHPFPDYYALQTGFQRLVLGKELPRGKLETVIYDFATGDCFFGNGGNPELLKLVLESACLAMEKGFKEPNPKHNHDPGYEKKPERYTNFLAGLEPTYKELMRMHAGGDDLHWAQHHLRDYARSWFWRREPSPYQLVLDGNQEPIGISGRAHGGSENCPESLTCRADDGLIFCSKCGLLIEQ